MKIAVDFGHGTIFDGGAVGILNEEKVIREYGPLVISKLQALEYEVLNVTPSSAASLGDSLEQRTTASNNFGADLFVSCHVNSFDDPKAHGCEVEYVSSKGKEYAERICNAIAELGYANREPNYRANLYVLNHTRAVAILIEPFFCGNEGDCGRYSAEALASAIVRGITGQASVVTPVAPTPVTEDCSGKYGTVTASVLNVRETAGGNIIGQLKKGDRVQIGSKQGNWYDVYFGDHGGFISADYVNLYTPQIVKPTVDGTDVTTCKYLQHELNVQCSAGLAEDNIPGPKTLNACILVKRGARGNITKWIQAKLGIAADGIFGYQTLVAIQNFQTAHGLSADGEVGQNTWIALLGL